MRTARLAFIEAMDDDFNSPKGLGILFDFVTEANALVAGKSLSSDDVGAARAMRDLIVELMGVFGIDLQAALESGAAQAGFPPEIVTIASELAGFGGDSPEEAMAALLEARASARAAKDWGAADAIRDQLGALGIAVKDTPQGPQVEFAIMG